MTRSFKVPIDATSIFINSKAVGPLADTGNPSNLGSANIGSSTLAARADHIHNTVTTTVSIITLLKWGS